MTADPTDAKPEAQSTACRIKRPTMPTEKGLELSDRKIVTSHVFPPIPIRDFDWCAFYDGDEESGFRGWGKTEQAAIDDLIAETE